MARFSREEVAANPSATGSATQRRRHSKALANFSRSSRSRARAPRPLSRSTPRALKKSACVSRWKRHAIPRCAPQGVFVRFAFQKDMDGSDRPAGSWFDVTQHCSLSLSPPPLPLPPPARSLSLSLARALPPRHTNALFSPLSRYEMQTRHLSHPAAFARRALLPPAARAPRRRRHRPAPSRGRSRHSVRSQRKAGGQAQRHDGPAAGQAQAGAVLRRVSSGVPWRGGGEEVRDIEEKEIKKEREKNETKITK